MFDIEDNRIAVRSQGQRTFAIFPLVANEFPTVFQNAKLKHPGSHNNFTDFIRQLQTDVMGDRVRLFP